MHWWWMIVIWTKLIYTCQDQGLHLANKQQILDYLAITHGDGQSFTGLSGDS